MLTIIIPNKVLKWLCLASKESGWMENINIKEYQVICTDGKRAHIWNSDINMGESFCLNAKEVLKFAGKSDLIITRNNEFITIDTSKGVCTEIEKVDVSFPLVSKMYPSNLQDYKDKGLISFENVQGILEQYPLGKTLTKKQLEHELSIMFYDKFSCLLSLQNKFNCSSITPQWRECKVPAIFSVQIKFLHDLLFLNDLWQMYLDPKQDYTGLREVEFFDGYPIVNRPIYLSNVPESCEAVIMPVKASIDILKKAFSEYSEIKFPKD